MRKNGESMKNIYIGDTGVFVEYVQLALNRAGFPTAIDGQFGKETCHMLKKFMGDNNMGCYVDAHIWECLIPYLKGYTTHTVKARETVYDIAGLYDTSIEAVLFANPSIDVMNLQIGEKICVPFGFPLVSEETAYTSYLNEFIIEGLSVRYPFIITGHIGRSAAGRRICCMQLGRGQTQVCYAAAFHANEWITAPVLLKFAEEYCKAYAENKTLYGEDVTALYERYSLFIIPMVNPDGVDLVNRALNNEVYNMRAEKIASEYLNVPFPSGWKANIDGIDLNLQFPAGWERAREIKYAKGYVSPAPRDFVGYSPLSAPESRAVYEFTRTHDFALVLAYHTQGEVIYWKYLDYEPQNSRRIVQYFSEVSGYAPELTPGTSGYAGYKDWFIQEYNRPGYTIEAGIGENPLDMSHFHKIYEDNKLILMGGMTQIQTDANKSE